MSLPYLQNTVLYVLNQLIVHRMFSSNQVITENRLLTNHKNMKAIRQNRRPTLLSAGFRSGTIFGGEHVDSMRLLIDGHRPSAALGRNRVHRLVLSVHRLHDAHGAVAAIGAEGEPKRGIKS